MHTRTAHDRRKFLGWECMTYARFHVYAQVLFQAGSSDWWETHKGDTGSCLHLQVHYSLFWLFEI